MEIERDCNHTRMKWVPKLPFLMFLRTTLLTHRLKTPDLFDDCVVRYLDRLRLS